MPLYYTVKLCIALQNPGFTGFPAEGLEKPNFDVIFSSRIINLLFDGLTCNTRGHFDHCNSQNIRAYYMLNHRIKRTYCSLSHSLYLSTVGHSFDRLQIISKLKQR